MPNPKGNEATLKKYKPKWKSGPTHTIRVPIALSDQILDYSHRLDEGDVSQSNLNPESLSQVIQDLEYLSGTPRNNFSKARKALLRSVINRLKALVASE